MAVVVIVVVAMVMTVVVAVIVAVVVVVSGRSFSVMVPMIMSVVILLLWSWWSADCVLSIQCEERDGFDVVDSVDYGRVDVMFVIIFVVVTVAANERHTTQRTRY